MSPRLKKRLKNIIGFLILGLYILFYFAGPYLLSNFGEYLFWLPVMIFAVFTSPEFISLLILVPLGWFIFKMIKS